MVPGRRREALGKAFGWRRARMRGGLAPTQAPGRAMPGARPQGSRLMRHAIVPHEAEPQSIGGRRRAPDVALRHRPTMKKGPRHSGTPGHKRSRKMPRDQRGREGGGGEESRDFSPNTGEILRLKACSYFTRLCFGCVAAAGVLFKPLRKSVNDLTLHRGLLASGVGSFATFVPRAGYKP